MRGLSLAPWLPVAQSHRVERLPTLRSLTPRLRSGQARQACLLTSVFRLRCHPERSEGSARHSVYWLLTSVFFLLTPALSPAQGITPQSIITTVAGGSWQFRGDGKPAVDAPLGRITAIAVDSAGNLLATDESNGLVVKITAAGILSVVGGNGIRGFSGDGGPATSASLNYPIGIAADSEGNIFISDRGNKRIRKVSHTGAMSTVAGNGIRGFSGDGSFATGASLNEPHGLAVDIAGNLYIADRVNNRIRKVSPTGIITTVAGNGEYGFSGDGGPATATSLAQPNNVAIDNAGNLYISDNDRIRRVNPQGTIDTIAGNGCRPALTVCNLGDGGPAKDAWLEYPSGIALDAAGNLFIGQPGRVRKVSPNGIINTIAGTGVYGFSGDEGPAVLASFNYIVDIAVGTTGNVYVADSNNSRIREISLDGSVRTIAGNGIFKFSGDGGAATSASLSIPEFNNSGLVLDRNGNLYFTDNGNHRVRKIGPDGIITTIAGNGSQGYSGDGGPANQASLSSPMGVAVDSIGRLYIADSQNLRVRRVDYDGRISTVAGNGGLGDSGDGSPATNASFSGPFGIALDSNGNLFIADVGFILVGGHRVRKVDPAGIISTVAGNGRAAFSGDGGPATEASLSSPYSVAVDTTGTIYIADFGNRRIRKVGPGGTISTMAGNGTAAFSGDGGPAILASLRGPSSVALDASDTLYIADRFNYRVRKIASDGTIHTVAGNGISGFSGDGAPAAAASLANPQGVAVDAAGNIYISDGGNDRIRKVWATKPGFVASPATLSFRAPAGAPLVAEQRISVLSEAVGLQWSAAARTEDTGNWLKVTPAAGSAPGTIAVGVNVSALNPGTYRGTVTVNAPLANPPAQTVAVTLTVEAALAPKLVAEPLALTFEGQTGVPSLPAKTLRLSNGGSGTVNWTAQAITTSGGNWLEVSPSSGTVAAGAPATLQIRVLPGSLTAGVYTASLRLESSTTGQTEAVPVTLLIAQPTQTILVSQTGLLFTGVEGNAVVPSQTFGILNTGQGTMDWTVVASTLSGGDWLSVTPTSGRSVAEALEVPLVGVSVNLTGLRAGQYSALVRVSNPGANNSPQFVTITLNVLLAGSNPGVTVRPTGLIFVRRAGTSSPGSQTVRLSTAAPGTLEAVANPFTFRGGPWLEALPGNLVFSPTDPQTITVQPSLGSLGPGEYFGALTLLFADRTSQTVNVLFVVTPAASAATAAPSTFDTSDAANNPAQDRCAAQRLYVSARSVGSNFALPVGWPNPIAAQVKDDCDHAVPNATVTARFSNGDPLLLLVSLGNGIYERTWQPRGVGQVRITVRAELPPLAPAEVQVDGQATGNPLAPALNAGGILNAASFALGEALAPGSLISVFGRNLAQGENHASQSPLEKTLGGATLNIGGIEAPLIFAGAGQINAQLPFDLAPNSRPAVVVRTTRADGTQQFTVPETITLATARPGIFTRNDQGTGQGKILNQDYAENSPANPAPRGSVIQVYATGLGATNPPVPSGNPGPRTAAEVTQTVTATIDGSSAPVQFAGLAPDFVGLYQVNVVVPANVRPGPEVPLVLIQNGVPSNTVTLAVR